MIEAKRIKGQVWSIDFITGMSIFLLVLLIAAKMLLPLAPSQEYNVAYRDALHISDALLSSGYPAQWNSTNAIILGIAQNNRIDDTHLNTIRKISYDRTKSLFHISNEYLFFFQNSTQIINTGQCVYGYNIPTSSDCTPQLGTINYDNMIKMDRIVIYNSTMVRLTVYVWN
jgi:hypothetical protein